MPRTQPVKIASNRQSGGYGSSRAYKVATATGTKRPKGSKGAHGMKRKDC